VSGVYLYTDTEKMVVRLFEKTLTEVGSAAAHLSLQAISNASNPQVSLIPVDPRACRISALVLGEDITLVIGGFASRELYGSERRLDFVNAVLQSVVQGHVKEVRWLTPNQRVLRSEVVVKLPSESVSLHYAGPLATLFRSCRRYELFYEPYHLKPGALL
jgi:hypothetical protein